jgi:hypothetical protein
VADFEAPVDLFTGTDIKEISISDMNGDGNKDIVFLDNQTIKIAYQKGGAGYYSAKLDGTKHLSIPASPDINQDTFTFSTWFKMTGENASFNYVVYSEVFDIRIASGPAQHLRFKLKMADGSFPGFNIYGWKPNLNEWYQLAFTYEASTGIAKAYINGALNKTWTISTPQGVFAETQPLMLGGVSNGLSLIGNIDDTAYHSTVLSDTQIAQLYNFKEHVDLNAHSASASLVSWWTMGDHAEDEFSSIFGLQKLKDVVGTNDGTPTTNMVREDKEQNAYSTKE